MHSSISKDAIQPLRENRLLSLENQLPKIASKSICIFGSNEPGAKARELVANPVPVKFE